MKDRQNPTGSQGPSSGLLRGRGASILIYFVLLPLLAALVLILPPIQVPARITSLGYTSVASKGAEVKNPDGAVVRIPEGAMARSGSIKLSTTAPQVFSASPEFNALPGYIELKSPLYNVSVQGDRPSASTLQIPVPNDAEPYETLDLWGQYNDLWFKFPFVLNRDDLLIESQLNFVPNAFFVAQTDPQAPLIAASITSRTAPQERAAKLLSEVNPTGLHLADQGGVAGEPVVLPETSAYSSFAVVPTVDNRDESGVRIDLTENMLLDEGQRKAHIQTLVDLAVQKLYAGYNIQYEGLMQQDSEAFTAFIKDLAREMHAAQKIVSVTLPAAKPIAAYEWDTEGYDWALIGRYADAVKIPMLDAAAFEGDNPLINQYLEWAAGQIDRYKLQIITSVAGRDQSGASFTPVSMSDALKLVGPVSFPAQVRPGDKVTLELAGLKAGGGVQHHEASGEFYFNYKDEQGASHTVWLQDADSVAKQAAMLLRYNMKGLVLQGVEGQNVSDKRIWDVLDKYQKQTTADVGSKLTLVWTLDGNKIGTSPAASPSLDWTVPDLTGEHKLDVALSVDDGQSFAPGGGGLALNIEQPKPTETPVPTKAPTKTPVPKPTKDPNATAVPTKAPAAPPAAPPPARVTGNRFGYGIQVNWTNSDRDTEMSQINQLGFGWAKIQVRWCDYESSPGQADLSSIDDFVAKAAARGVSVMFSVVCAPAWSRADGGAGGSGPPDDMQQAANFMSGLAGKYCGGAVKAIEVWNEHNLLTEWHGKPLSASLYMDMLKRSYTDIKSKCPSMIVVSGAPTPTGWNDGVVAIDDAVFLEQLYQNGLKQYSDAIGAHPSGFNVPALCNILDPNCNRPGVSFAAPFQSRHHSWGFLSTMITYRNIMVKYGDGGKQVWATEFGWPVGTGGTCGGGPCHPAGADNSPGDLATWFPQAFQWGRQQGWVGVMFVWNLDFRGGEVGAFHIDDQPAFGALAAMPK